MTTKFYSARIKTTDDAKSNRRSRHILANSGEIMESGEVRDLVELYVMSYDGELIRISDLDKDPTKQTEKYAVKAQADHGEYIDGELVPSIEKQFGSCRVWIDENGLNAQMYFADDDALANHAWAISEDASYSTGIDWFPNGYFGAGYEIDHAIGILREISMVLTGNDPQAKTIDTKHVVETQDKESEDSSSEETTNGDINETKESEPMTKVLDELNSEERDALVAEIAGVVEKFTTKPTEEPTEQTADNVEVSEEATTEEAPVVEEPQVEEKVEEPKTEESKDALHMPVVVVRDSVKQEKGATAMNANEWLHSAEGHRAFADTLKKAGRMGATFDAMWREEASKHMSLDGITGLPTPAPVEQLFINALEKNDGIISYFTNINTKSFRVNVLDGEGEGVRAKGHKKGDTKAFQEVVNEHRDVLVKMIYKKLDLDATELYENPELIDFRAKELIDAYVNEIVRGAIIGDGRTYESGADYRVFDGTRGLYSIKADADATTGAGAKLADKIENATNLYEGTIDAKGAIRTEGKQILVAKASAISNLLKAKDANGGYLVPPMTKVEDVLGVERVFTPKFMDDATEDAFLIVAGAYGLIGQSAPVQRSEFDTTTNTDILLVEGARGGSLMKEHSAVSIKISE